MSKRTRILIVTDSPVLPSGMAETTRLIFSTLLDLYPQQYELHQIGLFHCYAVTAPQWPIYPTMTTKDPDGRLRFAAEDKYGQKTFPKCVAKLQPDIVFAYGEPHRVLHLCAPPEKRRHQLILYVNFDGVPVPPQYCRCLGNADLIFTKSEFSKNALASAMPNISPAKLDYLYSPADTQRLKRVSDTERADLRRDLLPAWIPQNAFLLGWIGRNQWRKQVWLLYKTIHYLRTGAYFFCRRCGAVSLFDWDPSRQRHVGAGDGALELGTISRREAGRCCDAGEPQKAEPLSDVLLWLHMPKELEDDWPVDLLERQFRLERGRDIHYTEGYGIKSAFSPTDMPMLYNLWDCLLYLSGGEGFGLPAWEAMCCGLPAVYSNYSSHAEFLGRANAGLPVGGVLQPEKTSCIWRMVADVAQAVQAIRKFYFDRELCSCLGQNGRAFAETFALEVQAARWHQIFQRLLSQTPPRARSMDQIPVG